MSSRPTCSSAWASASSRRWHLIPSATSRCARSTRAISSSRVPRASASSAGRTCGATPTSSSKCSRRSFRARSSSAPSPATPAPPTSCNGDKPGLAVLADEVAHAGVDQLAPAPPGEDAVMADAGGEEVLAALARDVEAERMRRLRLPVSRDIVELAFDREQCRLADGLRPHQLLADEHATFGQREILEHGLDGIEVILGRQVQNRVVLVVEAPVRLGRIAVAADEMVVIIPMRSEVP